MLSFHLICLLNYCVQCPFIKHLSDTAIVLQSLSDVEKVVKVKVDH